MGRCNRCSKCLSVQVRGSALADGRTTCFTGQPAQHYSGRGCSPFLTNAAFIISCLSSNSIQRPRCECLMLTNQCLKMCWLLSRRKLGLPQIYLMFKYPVHTFVIMTKRGFQTLKGHSTNSTHQVDFARHQKCISKKTVV